MTSSTSSSESRIATSVEMGPSYVQEDSTILWLPEGPDVRGCPAHRDPGAVSLLIALAIVVLIAWGRTDVSESVKNPDWYWMMKSEWVNKSSIVIAGDSRAFIGVDPSAFEKWLNEPAVNVGFSSAKLTSPYLEYVRGAVDTSGENPTIIFGLSPFSFTNRRTSGTGYTRAIERNASGLRPMKKFIDETLAGLDALPISAVVGKMFSRLDWKLPISLETPFENDVQHVYHPNGWVEVTSHRDIPDMDSRRIEQVAELRKLIESKAENIDALCDLVRLWRAEGIRVVFFRLPVSEEVAAYEEELFEVDFDYLRDVFEQSGAVWIQVPESLELQTYDGSHLNASSARLLSDELARQIQNMNPPMSQD